MRVMFYFTVWVWRTVRIRWQEHVTGATANGRHVLFYSLSVMHCTYQMTCIWQEPQPMRVLFYFTLDCFRGSLLSKANWICVNYETVCDCLFMRQHSARIRWSACDMTRVVFYITGWFWLAVSEAAYCACPEACTTWATSSGRWCFVSSLHGSLSFCVSWRVCKRLERFVAFAYALYLRLMVLTRKNYLNLFLCQKSVMNSSVDLQYKKKKKRNKQK